MSRILALVLVATALAAGPAHADGETCRGMPATIVGEPGGTITGTDGDDVIVTNGARTTDAGAGDDTICVTGTAAYLVDAGNGDDVVDTTALTHRTYEAHVVLGGGADTFVGGNGRDFVTTGRSHADSDIDHVTTGRGHDTVYTGKPSEVNHDDVDLGGGNDHLYLQSDRNDGVLDGGTALDRVAVELAETGDWVVDDGAGEIRLAGVVVTRWAHLGVSMLSGEAGASVRYRGSDRDDHLEVTGVGLRSAALGAGDDHLVLLGMGEGPRGRLAGGPGHDSVIVHATQPVDLDLSHHRLSGYRVSGNEYYRAAAHDVRMIGSPGPDEFSFDGCSVLVRGAGGDDDLHWNFGGYSCRRHTSTRIFGGPGDDRLAGGPWRDHLSGGPGRDVARGRDDVDWCRAEREVDCEE